MTDFLAKCKAVSYSDMDSTTKARWPWLDVIADYGAVGDGLTDDSISFQSAIDDAVTKGLPIMVPPGHYAVKDLLVSSQIVMFAPGGPKLTSLDGNSDSTILTIRGVTRGDCDGTEVRGLRFNATTAGTGLLINNVRDGIFDNLHFVGCNIGLNMQTYSTFWAWQNEVSRCYFSANNTGLKFSKFSGATYKPNRNTIYKCRFINNVLYATHLESGQTNDFVKCDWDHNIVMVRNEDANNSWIGCCFEGGSDNTDIWMSTTVAGNEWTMTDCTVSHGVWDINNDEYWKLINNTSIYWDKTHIHYRAPYVLADASTDPGLYIGAAADTVNRFKIRADGQLGWGDGTAVRDVTLYRSAAGELTNSGSLINTGNIKCSSTNLYANLDNVSSASTITLPVGNFFTITGTTNIDTITAGDANNGRLIVLKFVDVLTVGDATGNIILAGNFTTSANDTLTLICGGINWYEISRSAN